MWNNAKWSAVESATRSVYPDGWAARTQSFPFSDLSPALDFEHDVLAAGGYGERVAAPGDVPGGRSNVRCTRCESKGGSRC